MPPDIQNYKDNAKRNKKGICVTGHYDYSMNMYEIQEKILFI